jgi:hypothetical protein
MREMRGRKYRIDEGRNARNEQEKGVRSLHHYLWFPCHRGSDSHLCKRGGEGAAYLSNLREGKRLEAWCRLNFSQIERPMKKAAVSAALQRKSHLCIPFLGIAWSQSQFPHSCVCERFIYSQDWSTYFPAA